MKNENATGKYFQITPIGVLKDASFFEQGLCSAPAGMEGAPPAPRAAVCLYTENGGSL